MRCPGGRGWREGAGSHQERVVRYRHPRSEDAGRERDGAPGQDQGGLFRDHRHRDYGVRHGGIGGGSDEARGVRFPAQAVYAGGVSRHRESRHRKTAADFKNDLSPAAVGSQPGIGHAHRTEQAHAGDPELEENPRLTIITERPVKGELFNEFLKIQGVKKVSIF